MRRLRIIPNLYHYLKDINQRTFHRFGVSKVKYYPEETIKRSVPVSIASRRNEFDTSPFFRINHPIRLKPDSAISISFPS